MKKHVFHAENFLIMNSREEYHLNSPVIHGVKMEPPDTDVSTDDFRETNSYLPLKSRIPSPSQQTNQFEESKMFVNQSTLAQFFPDRNTESITSSPASPLCEVKPKLEKTLVKVEKSQRWKCRICGMGFPTQSLQLNHRAEVHNNYPKKCSECGKSEIQNKKLRQHMRKFHPTKLVTCDVCSDGFLTNKDLKKHYKNIHQGKSTRNWYVPTFENAGSNSIDSKDCIVKTTTDTVESKDKLCLPIIKSEPL